MAEDFVSPAALFPDDLDTNPVKMVDGLILDLDGASDWAAYLQDEAPEHGFLQEQLSADLCSTRDNVSGLWQNMDNTLMEGSYGLDLHQDFSLNISSFSDMAGMEDVLQEEFAAATQEACSSAATSAGQLATTTNVRHSTEVAATNNTAAATGSTTQPAGPEQQQAVVTNCAGQTGTAQLAAGSTEGLQLQPVQQYPTIGLTSDTPVGCLTGPACQQQLTWDTGGHSTGMAEATLVHAGSPSGMVMPGDTNIAPAVGTSQWLLCTLGTASLLQRQPHPAAPSLATAGSLGSDFSDFSCSSVTALPAAVPNAFGVAPAPAPAAVAGSSVIFPLLMAPALRSPAVGEPGKPQSASTAATDSSNKAPGSSGDDSRSDSSDINIGSSKDCCPFCAEVKFLADRCCAAVLAEQINAGVKDRIAELLLQAANCQMDIPCLLTAQLPARAQFGDWWIAMSRARFSSSKQRAGAGTGTARNFNYNANTPVVLGNQSRLAQLQANGTSKAAEEGIAASLGDGLYYSIRSSQRTDGGAIISYGLAKNGRYPAQIDTGNGSSGSSSVKSSSCNSNARTNKARRIKLQPVDHWVEGGVQCSKTGSKYRGWRGDLHEWAFFVAVAESSSATSAVEKQPRKRRQAASYTQQGSWKFACSTSS